MIEFDLTFGEDTTNSPDNTCCLPLSLTASSFDIHICFMYMNLCLQQRQTLLSGRGRVSASLYPSQDPAGEGQLAMTLLPLMTHNELSLPVCHLLLRKTSQIRQCELICHFGG